MDKFFIDTNIILDLLLERHPFYSSAARLFTLADNKKIALYVSSLSFSNLDYIVKKQYGKDETRNILIKLKQLIQVLAVDENIINLALSSSYSDFEDAIQYYTAIESNIPIIITRNIKDFKDVTVPVMTVETYFTNYK